MLKTFLRGSFPPESDDELNHCSTTKDEQGNVIHFALRVPVKPKQSQRIDQPHKKSR